MCLTIGIDVGNYDTKTQNTTTPSSFRKYSILNKLNEESIFYEGNYYSPTEERNNQMLDKTENDYCIIISLFAIAKEIIYQIKSTHSNISNKDLQLKIAEVTEIDIGVGLPAGHLSALGAKTSQAYMDKMKNGFTFQYIKNDFTYTFNLKLRKCGSFPQDYTGVAFNKDLEIPFQFNEYYIIGIGGGTLDIIPIKNSKPLVENCVSLALGTTVMYTEIIKTMQHETGRTMDYSTVESILLEKPTIIDAERKEKVFELAKTFCVKVVDTMIQQGLKLQDYPCVFIGGGALMMGPFIKENPKIAKGEFVKDVRANAKYYAQFI